MSKLSPEQWQRDDDHTLHCIDYLRQYITCHSDLMLKASKDLTSFTKNNEHYCRDFGAVMSWVEEHSWSGYREWLENYRASIER